MEGDISPKEAIGGVVAAAVAGGVVIALIAAVTLIGWQAGWWFTTQNAKRQGQLENIQAHNIRNGYSNQQSLREQITAQIANVNTITVQIAEAPSKSAASALKAQREAVANIACQDASQIAGDPLPAQQSGWVKANCQAGSVRIGSPYYQAG